MIPWWSLLIVIPFALWFGYLAGYWRHEYRDEYFSRYESSVKRLSDYVSNGMQQANDRTETYKAMLYDAFRCQVAQSKGLQRQRRLINRLRREIADLTAAPSSEISNQP